MNYSDLYKASNTLHPGVPIETISELIHKARNLHEFDRTRLFHNIARFINTSVESVEGLAASAPLVTGEAKAEEPVRMFQTHEEIIKALLAIVEDGGLYSKTAHTLAHVIQFLVEQENLAAAVLDKSIEDISTGTGDGVCERSIYAALEPFMVMSDDLQEGITRLPDFTNVSLSIPARAAERLINVAFAIRDACRD